MRLGSRRAWFWVLVAWCVAADLVGAALIARAGTAAIMLLATTLVALEAGLATTRQRRIVALVTALLMAIVFLLAAFAATATYPSGIWLGGDPAVAGLALGGFQLRPGAALAVGTIGVAALVVTLVLGLQLSRTDVERALGEHAVSRQVASMIGAPSVWWRAGARPLARQHPASATVGMGPYVPLRPSPASSGERSHRLAAVEEPGTEVAGRIEPTEPWTRTGEPSEESERAMRTSLARLSFIREDKRPADVRGAMDLDGLVCPFGFSGAMGPISAHIGRGELVMVTADGSTGRTEALLRVLHGDRPPRRGQAVVAGYNLRHVRSYTVRGLHRAVGYVEDIDGRLTPAAALDAVLHDLALVTTGTGSRFRKYTDAIVAMGAVGLESRLGTEVADLPPLEQRLVAFAVALLHSPSILLTDDPTAGLDCGDARTVETLLRRLSAADLAVVVGTSDSRLLRRHRGRVLRL